MSIDHIAVRPGHPDYDAARTTIVGTAAPAVVLRPTSTAEVAASIRHAAENGLELAVRSGGHNALGFGNSDGGVVLDLSRIAGVEVLDGGRVRIGAGATWGPAATTLAEHGLAITSGDTVSVGVGGLTQAGGIGWMVRKYGLTIDNVLAAEMVTAAGEVVRADPETNPELFWGLLGGAGNFGVVTSFDYQAQQVSTVHFGVITYALEDVAQLLKGWREVMRNAPDELTTTLVLMPGFGDFPAGAMLYACYCGDDPSEIDPLRAIGSVTSDDVSERPYADVLEEAHPPQGVLPVIGNTLVDSLSADCIRAIVTAYDEGGRVVFLRSLGGAVGRVSPEATAFAHRDAEALIVSAKFLPESADPEDLAALYPAETLARLVELKRVWDPANLFRRNFNIKP
jgi:FAD/FMN-containing dehydrogenase